MNEDIPRIKTINLGLHPARPQSVYDMVIEGDIVVACTDRRIDLELCLEGGRGRTTALMIMLLNGEIEAKEYTRISQECAEAWIAQEVEDFCKEHNQTLKGAA